MIIVFNLKHFFFCHILYLTLFRFKQIEKNIINIMMNINLNIIITSFFVVFFFVFWWKKKIQLIFQIIFRNENEYEKKTNKQQLHLHESVV